MVEKVLNWVEQAGEQSRNHLVDCSYFLEFCEERYEAIFGYGVGKTLLWANVLLLWSVILLGITSGI